MKDYLRKTARRARYADEQEEPIEGFLHCRFVGPPGTGKTTVARRVGEIFHAMGLLSTGRLREVNPISDFGSQYVSEYAQRVAEQFNLAKGGVLFIDEAYQLAEQDQGRQIVHQIVQTLTQPSFADTLVVMAGYREPMNRLVEQNSGLESRIPNEIVFQRFSVEELIALFHNERETRQYVVRSEDRETFDGVLRAAISTERVASNFSNARTLKRMVQEVLDRQRERLEVTGNKQGMRLLPQDLGEVQSSSDDVQRLLRELDDRFVGMSGVKSRFVTIANDVQMQAELGGQSPKAPRMLFLGNPGTGKTTAARELARILKAVGAVTTDRFVEIRGNELKGVVLGQTEEKVTNTFSDARGGVLFIDEAYSLASDPQRLDVYGAAAIDTLVGQTELPENAQTAIILAGYPEPMRDFLGTNPGLARRFPTKVMFPDYTNEECLEILQRWFTRTQSGQSLPLDSPEVGEALFAAIARRRSMPHFGNAGDIEVLGGCIVSARNARLRTVNPAERRDQSRPTIEDIGSTRDARDWPPAWTPKDTRHVPPKRAARLQPTCHVARDAV